MNNSDTLDWNTETNTKHTNYTNSDTLDWNNESVSNDNSIPKFETLNWNGDGGAIDSLTSTLNNSDIQNNLSDTSVNTFIGGNENSILSETSTLNMSQLNNKILSETSDLSTFNNIFKGGNKTDDSIFESMDKDFSNSDIFNIPEDNEYNIKEVDEYSVGGKNKSKSNKKYNFDST